jgi:hypothetical protein
MTVTVDQSIALDSLIFDHNAGDHHEHPRTGCAGCLLSGALE